MYVKNGHRTENLMKMEKKYYLLYLSRHSRILYFSKIYTTRAVDTVIFHCDTEIPPKGA
jgi:hypothetical protein